jgi:hypothetical protein
MPGIASDLPLPARSGRSLVKRMAYLRIEVGLEVFPNFK